MSEEPEQTGQDARTYTYLIYAADTGDLVHGHKAVILPYGEAPAEKELTEDALKLAVETTGRGRDELRVLSVSEDELEPGFEYRVDPGSERLERITSEGAA